MKAFAASEAQTRELGAGFILVERAGGARAVFAPRLASAGVVAMMSAKGVNARAQDEVTSWLESFALAGGNLAQPEQVHGMAVVRVPPAPDEPADGLWSDDPQFVLSVKAADCAPVWLADSASTRFALLHAGWRGASREIAARAVTAMRQAGSRPQDLIVAVGPHLRSCCFEVGPEVAERFSKWPKSVKAAAELRVERMRDDAFALDLAAAIEAQLVEAGVRAEEIFVSTTCTRCNDGVLHSYRRNGAGGPLMIAVAARRP